MFCLNPIGKLFVKKREKASKEVPQDSIGSNEAVAVQIHVAECKKGIEHPRENDNSVSASLGFSCCKEEKESSNPVMKSEKMAQSASLACPVSGTSSNSHVGSKKKCPMLHTPVIRGVPTFSIPCALDGGIPELRAVVAAAVCKELSPKEIAVIKEGWNKALAFRDRLFFEALAERWFYLCPSVSTRLGLESEDVLHFMYGWIDLAVHTLMPETEVIYRETFQAVHVVSQQRFQTVEAYGLHLFMLGVDTKAMLALDEAWYFSLQTHTPYFEESDLEELKDRNNAPLTKMFRIAILSSYLLAADNQAELAYSLTPLSEAWEKNMMSSGKEASACRRFHELLFTENPDLLDHFAEDDINSVGGQFMQVVRLSISSSEPWEKLMPMLRVLAEEYKRIKLPSWAYPMLGKSLVTLFIEELSSDMTSEMVKALVQVFDQVTNFVSFPQYLVEKLFTEASDFFDQAASHFAWTSQALSRRKMQALREIYTTGTHELTEQELSFGAQLAWRNSGKCCGRISWNTLLVRDCRYVENAATIFDECVEHQRLASAGSNIQSVMTLFRPRQPMERWGIRIWNSQFIRFACWKLRDGTVLGDPANKELTEAIIKQFPKWKGPEVKTAFDPLPLIIEMPGKPPQMFEIPHDIAITVDIEHPEVASIRNLGFRWCAVPTITNFNLRLAGIDFVCCPFNGWFLDLEVARNLCDRYDAVTKFVECFPDLLARKAKGDASWYDCVLVEVSRAVYYSFMNRNMTMVDRPTVSRQFAVHLAREREAGREVPAQWSWIGGLLGPGYAPWKHECRDFVRNPQYQYQCDIFQVAPREPVVTISDDQAADKLNLSLDLYTRIAMGAKRWRRRAKASTNARAVLAKGVPSVSVLFGSETGTAESYAKKVAEALKLLKPAVGSLNDASSTEGRSKLLLSDVVLIVTSTFGMGQPPCNATKFFSEDAPRIPSLALTAKGVPVKLAVCAIGSSMYPDFAAFGRKCWNELHKAGAETLVDLVTADEISGQFAAFQGWLETVKLAIMPPRLANALSVMAPSTSRVIVRSRKAVSLFREFVPVSRDQYALCPITANKELRVDANIDEGRSTHRVEIDVSCLGLHPYSTGDHCAILPVQPHNVVAEICSHLKVSLFDFVEVLDAIEIKEEDAKETTQEVISIGGALYEVTGQSHTLPYQSTTWLELFSTMLETTLQPSFVIPLLELLMSSRQNMDRIHDGVVSLHRNEGESVDGEMKALEDILDRVTEHVQPNTNYTRAAGAPKTTTKVDPSPESKAVNEVIDKHVHLGSLLATYSGLAARLDLEKLLSILPKARPRFYSISTSDLVSPNTIALTVGLVLEKTSQGTIRRGTCSTYLCHASPNLKVLASVRQSSFRLPADSAKPIICVGPGTGLAPFVGFMEHRIARQRTEGTRPGKTLLFTGARTSGDMIYSSEIEWWRSADFLDVHVAISREGKRQRVQDLVREHAEEVLRILLNDEGYLYVCGDARMADDTCVVIMEIISEFRGVSRMAAKDQLASIRDSGRYQTDVWGLTSFFSQGLTHYAEKKAASARSWLQAVQGR